MQGQQQSGIESKFTQKITEHDKIQKDQDIEKAYNRLVFTSGYGKQLLCRPLACAHGERQKLRASHQSAFCHAGGRS